MTTQHYLPPAPLNTPTGSLAWAEWYRLLRQTAESGQTAYITISDPTTGLQSKLNSDAADTLNGTISFGSLGAFKVGTVTWNGTSATGTGVMFTQNGIVGANSGSIKFVIKSDGTATFGGALTAASGTFAGDVFSSGGIFTTGYSSTSYTIDGDTYDPSIVGEVSTSLGSGVPTGVVGVSTYSVLGRGGVFYATGAGASIANSYIGLFAKGRSTTNQGFARGASFTSEGGRTNTGIEVSAVNDSTGSSKSATGISVSASSSNSSTPVTGLSVTQSGGSSTSSGIQVSSDSGIALHILSGTIKMDDTSYVGTGASTATFPGNNKPGSNSTNTWLKININGTDYYIPVWT